MSQTDNPTIQSLSEEVSKLRQELQLRDQLVQQLSCELFRLVKGNNNFVPQIEASANNQAEVQALQEQLEAVEQQVNFIRNRLHHGIQKFIN